jgi:hypothetical protein
MYYVLLIYFESKPLHVSSRLAANHQEAQICVNSNWYSRALCWLYQLLSIQILSPDDEQQACSKYVEPYYWNILIENSAACWFVLYGYTTMHDQQNIKLDNNPLALEMDI